MAVTALGMIPVVSWVSNAIQAIDQAAAEIKRLIDENDKKAYETEVGWFMWLRKEMFHV